MSDRTGTIDRPGRRWWTIAVSCAAVALVIASMAALYTALSAVAVDTGATQLQLTWVMDGYTLALSCLVLPAGAVGDRYGRRKVLIVGLAIFALASLVPLALTGPGWLIGSRAVAGVGAALVMPSTLSIMTAEFPESKRGMAVALWAGVAGAGAGIGVLAAGQFMAMGSWQSIFLGFAVIAAVLFVLGFSLPESKDPTHTSIDFLGALWAALAIGALVVAVIEAPQRGWSDPLVLALFVGAAVCAIVFVVIERRTAHPLLPIELFGNRGFGSGTLAITLQFLAFFGMYLLMVQYLQLILGYEPLAAAAGMVPVLVPVVGISIVAPWLAAKVGLRWVFGAGFAAIAAGFFLIGRLDLTTDYLDMMGPLLLASVGLGLSTAPATLAIVSNTPTAKQGVAAAVNDAAREVGAAIGIALAGSMLAAGYSARIGPILPQLPPDARGPVSGSLAAALEVVERAGPAARPLEDIAKSAFIHGMSQAALVISGISAVAMVVLAWWAPGRSGSTSTGTAGDRVAVNVEQDSVSSPGR